MLLNRQTFFCSIKVEKFVESGGPKAETGLLFASEARTKTLLR